MTSNLPSIWDILLAVGGVGAVLTFIVFTIIKSEEPARMVVKWILTGIISGVLFGVVGPIVGRGGYSGAFVGIPAAAVCGLFLAIVWRHTLSELIASPFASLYNGGNTPPDPQPLYSTARARQKNGQYLEAVAAVREQLARFPTDVEGHLLLAEIQAENLKDLPSAEATIEHFCSQPGHAPRNVAFALYSMADWYLSQTQDIESARRCLGRIQELLPDTEFALGAAQRIAHLENPEIIMRGKTPQTVELQRENRRYGLMKTTEEFQQPEPDQKELARQFVEHLEKHPLDWEAREKLAVIYAEQYQRLDMALDQLEQLIATPNQPSKNIVRWLNLMCDLQVRYGGTLEQAQQTLERIVERGPNLAAAENARKRLNLLKLEFKANEKKESVKMGTYEQNIGLKSARNPR